MTADSTIGASAYVTNASPRRTAVDPHILVIQGDDTIYTAREKHTWNGWCLLIQGDEIKYTQENSRLSVIDAGGEKCNLDILRQQTRFSP